MYQLGGWLGWFSQAFTADATTRRSTVVSRNVVFLGLTSLFTDISSEMVVSVLPIYLVGFLRLSPVQFGFVEGLYQAVAGVVQLASGVVTDRLRRYKEVAATGYVASLVCRIGLLATSGTTAISVFVTLDRLGKGLRTAPRDALISLSTDEENFGTAFGIHRAMDAMGAMLGPIVAFAVLNTVVDGFDVVFVFSLCSAIIGVAVLGLLVENKRAMSADARNAAPGLSELRKLLQVPAYRHLAFAALLLGSMTISDGFLYLTLQSRGGLSSGTFPLLYVLTSACYLLFALPAGRLADRIGRFRVFILGHALLLGLYATLATVTSGLMMIGLVLLLLGLYYAATEGVLMAIGSGLVGESLRTTGLAVLATTLGVARFAGSVLFGICWTTLGLQIAVTVFLTGQAAALAIIVMTRPRSHVR
jgi:MFS family permease